MGAIAYFCPRVNLLKLYGPVLAEQMRRGGPGALLIVPLTPLITYAAKNRSLAAALRLQQIRAEIPGGVEIACVPSTAAFRETLRERRVQAVVGVGLRLPRAIRDEVLVPSRAQGVKWCSLGYLHEELAHVLWDGPEILDDWDLPTTFSQAGVDRLRERLTAHGVPDPDRVTRLRPVGSVECDQVADFDRDALRKKYGLPADRPVICFATAPPFESFKAHHAMRWLFFQPWQRGDTMARVAARRWRRGFPEMDRLTGYADVMAAVRRFADRHRAVLVAKTRDKHDDPRYVRRAADHLVSDGGYYPFRTLELLHASDLYIGVYSSTAFEAAFLGRRCRTIAPFPSEVLEDPRFLELKRDFFFGASGEPGIWSAPGFCDLTRTYVDAEWAAFEDWSAHGALDTRVDAAVKGLVVRRVLGFDDCKASRRFLDALETTLEGVV